MVVMEQVHHFIKAVVVEVQVVLEVAQQQVLAHLTL
jgi:hypothetical protein